ncbi:MAG: hypothetical protein AB8E82_16935 [Aureispira sp.]
MTEIEVLDESELSPKGKVYTETMVAMAAFFGSPLAAGYLFAENYKVLRQPHKVQRAWAVAIGGTIALFVLIYIVEQFIEVPTIGFWVGVAFGTKAMFRNEQGAAVTEHIAKGGELHSGWRAAGVSFAAFGVILIFVIGSTFLLFSPKSSEVEVAIPAPEISSTVADFQTRSYGDAAHVIVFNRADISDEVIDAMASELTQAGFFDAVNSKTVYLEINPDRVYNFVVTQADVDPSDPATQTLYKNAKAQLEAFLANTTVELLLMDEDLEYTLETF